MLSFAHNSPSLISDHAHISRPKLMIALHLTTCKAGLIRAVIILPGTSFGIPSVCVRHDKKRKKQDLFSPSTLLSVPDRLVYGH